MEVDGGDNEIHAKFYGNYGGNQGILVERSGGDNVKLLAGYTGYGGGLESKSALRFSVGGNNLSTPAVHITESSVVNISEYIKFPYVNSTNTPTPNIPNVATQKRAIWMDMEGDESYLEYGHVDAGQTYTQFRVTDNNSGDRYCKPRPALRYLNWHSGSAAGHKSRRSVQHPVPGPSATGPASICSPARHPGIPDGRQPYARHEPA